MTIPDDLMQYLCCPAEKQALRYASAEQLGFLNAQIEKRKLYRQDGAPQERRLSAVLLREDNKLAYPIVDGIPQLLIPEGLLLGELPDFPADDAKANDSKGHGGASG